ncbi:SUMF1/EgtB/PvdOfamily nonheme iron enzyme, partial [Cylindrospermopsis raciborskii LB2897]|nr:SUMF1/EgtB/PvdOfamily nonheme iron enzyme [Cylindrospermopsis raciborskii LB2897]
FNHALNINPNYAQAYNNRGIVRYELGDHQGAMEDFNHALNINPDYAQAYNNRGIVRTCLGERQLAIEDFSQATIIAYNYTESYINKGYARYELGSRQKAIEDFNQALNINPNYAQAYNNRGVAYTDLGDREWAKDDFSQALQINPDYAEAHNNRGIVCYKLGDNQGAIEDFNQALKINSNCVEAYNMRGNIRYELGDRQGAIEDFNRALNLGGLDLRENLKFWEKGGLTLTIKLRNYLNLKILSFEVVSKKNSGEIIKRDASAIYFVEDLGDDITLEMVEIPGGTFTINSAENRGNSEESAEHLVTVPSFFMGKYEITQEQYQAVTGDNPSYFKGDKRPVERVKWNQALDFCEKLSQITGRIYTLPSEAQWEYACRAGTSTEFYFGDTITTDLVNYHGDHKQSLAPQGQYRKQTTEVGSFPPNPFGLYDMHGNVWEWCLDHWHDHYQDIPKDSSPWVEKGIFGLFRGHVLRGGSWCDSAQHCGCGSRNRHLSDKNNLGFRVVCSNHNR